MSDAVQNRKPRGRPLAFDRREALRQAMRLFWDRGYEGTTFDELIAAMGISASSFQNSFGSKQALYAEATRLYLEEKANWFAAALNDCADTRAAFEKLVAATADAFAHAGQPAGCMVSLGGIHAAPACDPIRGMMVEQRALSERLMRARLDAGIAAGELPESTDTAAMAAFFSTVFRGMAVQARDGADQEQLLKIGRLAMQVWPDRSKR